MTTKDLIAQLATDANMDKNQVAHLLQASTELITQALLENKTVHIQNFGDWEVRKKKERLSVHPKTGIRTLTPPKLQLNFKQSPIIKDELNK